MPALRAYNQRTRKTPGLHLPVGDEAEAQAALRRVLDRDQRFALRSSGHCFAGLSQSEDVVIDTGPMSSVRVDPVKRRLVAGPGATLGMVNAAAGQAGLVLPAGYCQTVTLGGHVPGGGIGVLTRAMGLASDRLIGARMLLADGRAVEVTEDAHSDLLWALRGGGAGSLGLLTELTLALNPDPGMSLVDARAHLRTALAAEWIEGWLRLADADRTGASFQLYVSDGGDDMLDLTARITVTGDSLAAAVLADAVRGLGPRTQVLDPFDAPYPVIADEIWPREHYPVRSVAVGSGFLGRSPRAAFWTDLAVILNNPAGRSSTLTVESLGGAFAEPGPSETAFWHRGARHVVQISTSVPHGPGEAAAVGAFDRLRRLVAQAGTGAAYVNYPEPDRPDWPRAVHGGNLERLVDIKRRYDPTNRFRHAMSIPLTV